MDRFPLSHGRSPSCAGSRLRSHVQTRLVGPRRSLVRSRMPQRSRKETETMNMIVRVLVAAALIALPGIVYEARAQEAKLPATPARAADPVPPAGGNPRPADA